MKKAVSDAWPLWHGPRKRWAVPARARLFLRPEQALIFIVLNHLCSPYL